jgi:putative flippase GtrA
LISPSHRRFLLFCVAGTIGLAVDISVLYALAPLLGWYVGRLVSFFAAATATYLFNRRWTFADASAASREGARPYLRYLASMLAGAAVNYGVYVATLRFVPIEHAAALGVAFGSIAGLGFNFLAAHFILFPSSR